MRKPIRTRPVVLCTHLALAFGIGFGISTQAFAVCNVSPAKLTTDDTLYWCGNPGQYDEVEINTGQTASITPLTGYGIYNQGGTLKKVSVKTTGLQADAIMQRSSANLTIGDDLKIVTTGLFGRRHQSGCHRRITSGCGRPRRHCDHQRHRCSCKPVHPEWRQCHHHGRRRKNNHSGQW